MSSSDNSSMQRSASSTRARAAVTPWALDELEMPNIFEPALVVSHHVEPVEQVENHPQMSPQELARIEAAAYAHGRADGEKTAWKELLPRIESIGDALGEALEDVRLHQARWTANAEENLAVLAVAVARQLIAREVACEPSIIVELVQRALAQFPLDQPVTIRLHPDDAGTCNELLQPAEGNRFHEIRWAADAQIQRGGCMVEGRERIIDGRVDTALERIYRAVGNVQAT